jgi:hypothetical protein
MTAHVKVAGTAQPITGIHVKVGGVIQAVQSGWVKIGGVIQQFYSALSVALNNGAIDATRISGASTTATISFTSAGLCDYTHNGNSGSDSSSTDYTWLVAGANSDVEIYVSATGDTPDLTGTLNTWLALSTTRTWTLTALISEVNSVTLTISFRNATTTAALAGPVTVTLAAER